jgi:hypothetical protein
MMLAAHCQHLARWRIPREDFPRDRQGYRRWRKEVARYQAEEARGILKEAGYPAQMGERVTDFLLKRRLRTDPEVASFEDAICLVFLENELVDFASRHSAEKVIAILQRTWEKMTPDGRELALASCDNFPAGAAELLCGALGS